MCRKNGLVCLVILLTISAMPAFAAVTVTYPAITHSWPDNSADVRDSSAAGSRLWVNTMAGTIFNGDPNDLYSDQSPPKQLVGESFNDRAVTETFGVPLDNNTPYATPYGFTLTHITIAANGNGSDANQPMSLHIFDLNQVTYQPQDTSYTLLESCGFIPEELCFSDMLPPGDLLSSSASFVFRRDATPNLPHTFVDFNFTGYDSFDLEPGHFYAFEIWPTKGDDPGWFWHRYTSSQNYPYGKCYRVDPPADWRNLTATRQAVVSGVGVQVMGVYGIPCDGNAFHPMPQDYSTDVSLNPTLTWHSGRWAGPGSHSSHNLYLSTNELYVRYRNASTRIHLTDASFPDPYNPSYAPTNLLSDKVYYWRVDEYNDLNNPAPPHHSRPTDTDANYWGRGDYGYWRFTTQSMRAKSPVPANGSSAMFTSTNAQLSWTKGCYVGSADINGHQVYFGTSFNDVSNATTATSVIYRGAVSDPCYPLKNLVPDYTPFTSGTTYYWRIDEVNGTTATTYKGATWNFLDYERSFPTWRAGARCFLNGPSGSFDEISVKDPSIVYSGGKWHLFYTGKNSSSWRMGYANATTIAGLNTATRTLMSSLNSGTYFCAPQVFWFAERGQWYLIYQSGLGATFSTNTDINNPSGWAAGASMGISVSGAAVDYWCISDGTNVYCFYSPQDGSYVIKRRSTTVADFPYNWSADSNVCSNTFEAPHVYKNIADGQYYMMVEDLSRHFELWTASSPGGTWTQINENWAASTNLIETEGHWTDQVSHGEILRAGVDEKLEISDINRCEVLFQGVLNGSYGDYGNIPYDLGTICECPVGRGDFDIDCDVDFADFAFLAGQWLQPPGVPSADIAPPGDGIVDMDDLGVLVDNWLWGKDWK
jgi:hypothetical protein